MKHRCVLPVVMCFAIPLAACDEAPFQNGRELQALQDTEDSGPIDVSVEEGYATDDEVNGVPDSERDSASENYFDSDCTVENSILVPREDGWVDGCDNVNRFQGYWSAYSDIADESLYETQLTVTSTGAVCAKGWIAPTGVDSAAAGGVGIALRLCQTRNEDGPVNTHTMGTCPWALSPFQKLGFHADLNGTVDSDFRVVYGKPDAPRFAYIPVSPENDGGFFYLDAMVPSDPNIDWMAWGWDEVDTIRFEVTAENVTNDGKFDFCVTNLEPIPGHIDFL